jgi:hypothetical protein
MAEHVELRDLSVAQLVERFVALAIEFDEAETIPETDRIYWLRDGIERELKARVGEAWRALLPIYLHPDICIRHQAAEATRDQVLELARDRMLAIDDEDWAPPDEYVSMFEPALLAGRSRKPSKLNAMSVEQLVERFTVLSLEQDEALLMDEIAKFNRLYDQREAVELELKAREGDQWKALLAYTAIKACRCASTRRSPPWQSHRRPRDANCAQLPTRANIRRRRMPACVTGISMRVFLGRLRSQLTQFANLKCRTSPSLTT